MCVFECEGGGGGRGYIQDTYTYWKCMFGCMSVFVRTSLCSFMFQFCLWGSFTTLDNFITAHLVLFILITQAAKHRLRIQAFPELHAFSRCLSSSLFLTAARLPPCLLHRYRIPFRSSFSDCAASSHVALEGEMIALIKF